MPFDCLFSRKTTSNYRLYYQYDFWGQYNNGMQMDYRLQLPFENLGGVMMTRGMSNVVKGIAAGMLVGTAAYMAGHTSKTSGKQMKKKAAKAMKTVGNIFENISYMM